MIATLSEEQLNLEWLASLGTSTEFLSELLAELETQMGGYKEKLQTLSLSTDATTLAAATHKLKGGASSLGLTTLPRLLGEFDVALRENNTTVENLEALKASVLSQLPLSLATLMSYVEELEKSRR